MDVKLAMISNDEVQKNSPPLYYTETGKPDGRNPRYVSTRTHTEPEKGARTSSKQWLGCHEFFRCLFLEQDVSGTLYNRILMSADSCVSCFRMFTKQGHAASKLIRSTVQRESHLKQEERDSQLVYNYVTEVKAY